MYGGGLYLFHGIYISNITNGKETTKIKREIETKLKKNELES